jgi:hypothetical protein
MDTSKPETLKKVTDAISDVQNALQDPAITVSQQANLESTLVVLRDIQNSIIIQSEQALVDALKSNTIKLEKIADEIQKDAEKLDKITGLIKTVSDLIGGLINITTSAISGGFIRP